MVRGFDKENAERAEEFKRDGKPYKPLTRERVLEAWNVHSWQETVGGSRLGQWGKRLICTSQRFVTLGTALVSDELYAYWHTFRTIERVLDLSLNTGKREKIAFSGTRTAMRHDADWGKENPSQRLFPTYARTNTFYNFGIETQSALHALPWDILGSDECNPDIDGADHFQYTLEAQEMYH